MTISSISELQEASIDNLHILSSDQVTTPYIASNLESISKNLSKQEMLFEGSNKTSDGYDSCHMKYENILSSAVLKDIKTFLNHTNGLVDSLKRDYNLDNIFNGKDAINQLTVTNQILATNLYLTNELTSLYAKLTNLTAETIKTTELTADSTIKTANLSVTNNNSYVNGKYVVNELCSGTGSPLIITKNSLYPNRYYVSARTTALSAAGGSINVPIGAILPFCGEGTTYLEENGFLECNGRTVATNLYPELAAILGDRFVNGSSITLPNLTDGRYLAGNNNGYDSNGASTWGCYMDECVPNIKGTFFTNSINAGNDDAYNGAVQRYTYTDLHTTTSRISSEVVTTKVVSKFDASTGQVDPNYPDTCIAQNSSVFGKDDDYNKVRPKTFTVKWYIKAREGDYDFTLEQYYALTRIKNELSANWLSTIPLATDSKIGGIKLYTDAEALKLGSGYLPVKLADEGSDKDGNAYVELNKATTQKLGGIRLKTSDPTDTTESIQRRLQVNDSGEAYTALSKASSTNFGLIKVGNPSASSSSSKTISKLQLDDNGVAYCETASGEITAANTTTLGGIKLFSEIESVTDGGVRVKLNSENKAYVTIPTSTNIDVQSSFAYIGNLLIQWGDIDDKNTKIESYSRTVNLTKTFQSNYAVSVTVKGGYGEQSNDHDFRGFCITTKSNNSFTFKYSQGNKGKEPCDGYTWIAIGI